MAAKNASSLMEVAMLHSGVVNGIHMEWADTCVDAYAVPQLCCVLTGHACQPPAYPYVPAAQGSLPRAGR